MARTIKTGLEYFPTDIDLFQDIKVRKLIKHQGGKAVTVYILLLCLIYKDGYYMTWDEEMPFIVSEQTGFEEAYIGEVVRCCVKLGLFDAELFGRESILTSRGIQERYKFITLLSKRKAVITRYNLINSEEKAINSEEKAINSELMAINSEEMQQRKEKKRKEKEFAIANNAREGGSDEENLEEFFAEGNMQHLAVLQNDFGLNSIAELRVLAVAVVNEWRLAQKRHSDYGDWVRHLIAQMRIKSRDRSGGAGKQGAALDPLGDEAARKRQEATAQRLREMDEHRKKAVRPNFNVAERIRQELAEEKR